jgi:hypothetical protein
MQVVRRNDDQLGQTLFERDHVQEVFPVAPGIRIGFSADKPRALLAQRNVIELVYKRAASVKCGARWCRMSSDRPTGEIA